MRKSITIAALAALLATQVACSTLTPGVIRATGNGVETAGNVVKRGTDWTADWVENLGPNFKLDLLSLWGLVSNWGGGDGA